MYGLIGAGRQFKGEAMQGLSDVANTDQQREMTNQSLKNAKKMQEKSTMASGAVTGAMIGAQYGSIGGVPGMAIGAGIGLLAGWELS